LTTDWQSGRVKQFLIAHVLRLRRLLPALFDEGTYAPILAEGERTEHLFPYVRTHANSQLLVVAPRLCSAIIDEGNDLTAARQWGETTLWLPTAWNDQAFDLLSGEPIRTVNVQGTPALRITEILQYFPVGLVGNQRVIE
jgi:(1->4)-alpha-D-glucan 1-alpha-D-glucosylmutase